MLLLATLARTANASSFVLLHETPEAEAVAADVVVVGTVVDAWFWEAGRGGRWPSSWSTWSRA